VVGRVGLDGERGNKKADAARIVGGRGEEGNMYAQCSARKKIKVHERWPDAY